MEQEFPREVEVSIHIETNKMTPEQYEHLKQAEKHLLEAGISFDTGGGFGGRDWEWDWSLEGPVTVYYLRNKGESDEEESSD